MKEKLKDGNLQTVSIAEKEVIWMDDHEIWINEHMFDVFSKTLENGIYTFTGLYDLDETEVVRQIGNSINEKDKEMPLLKQWYKWLQLAYDFLESKKEFVFSPLKFFFTVHDTPLIQMIIEVITPPPQSKFF